MRHVTNVLLAFIVGLLLINVYQNARLEEQLAQLTGSQSNTHSVKKKLAEEWGDKAIDLYNMQNHQALYDLFHPDAKAKISTEQLASQLNNLFKLFGQVEKIALLNTVKVGEKNGEAYFQFMYQAKVSNPKHQKTTLVLSMVKNADEYSLYGFKLNARQSLD